MITVFKIFEKKSNFFNINENQSELEKNWYCSFINISDIFYYYSLSKEHNVEIHFFETDDPDIISQNLLPVTIFTDEITYDNYYSDFSETDENFNDQEISDIIYWLKIKKYNL
jgi:hypothetical protein